MHTSDGLELREGLYFQDGPQTLYQVSTVYPRMVRARVCLDGGKMPGRTAVRTLLAEQAHGMTSASDTIVTRYHAMLDGDPDRLNLGELDLLASYAGGPRIWDAADIVPTVYALAERGLIEPAMTDLGDGPVNRGAYQLTDKGRQALSKATP
jgi:hypothetical protein